MVATCRDHEKGIPVPIIDGLWTKLIIYHYLLQVDFLESYAKEAARRKMIYLVQFGLHAYFSHKVGTGYRYRTVGFIGGLFDHFLVDVPHTGGNHCK